MAIFRTPSAVYHDTVSFVENGELGSQGVLNRPMFLLNDNTQFLKEAQESETLKGQNLANTMGETYSISPIIPVWNTSVITQGVNHHSAIEELGQQVSVLQTSGDAVRIDNIDTFLIGEDSNTGLPPDWSTVATPFFVQLGDTHHQAIERLDIAAEALRGDVDTLLTTQGTQGTSIATLQSDLTDVQVAIGSLQTVQAAISVIVTNNTSQIDTNESQIVLTRTEVSLLEDRHEATSLIVTENSCVIEKMKTEINVLRGLHSLPAIVSWCP